MANRRQEMKDWLLSTDNPEAEFLLNSLNEMNLDDWEQKYRGRLRRLKGYADMEKPTVALRHRVKGEFDNYVDNPEWYIKGKAAKLGVSVGDVKKALGELQKEKDYFEARERRKKEVEEDFKWNFASDFAKQRYIDTPEKSYWANPELSFEHIPDIADAFAGFAAGAADLFPGIGGTLVGPAIRTTRNIANGQKFDAVLKNFLADAGANAGAEYLPGALMSIYNKVAKKGSKQVGQYTQLGNDIDKSKEALNAFNKVANSTDVTKLRNLDPTEISKFKAEIDALPDSPVKRDILNLINTRPSEAIDTFKKGLSSLGVKNPDAVLKSVEDRGFKFFTPDPSYNLNRAKLYSIAADDMIKQSKKTPDAKFNPYDAQGQLRKDGTWNNELGQTILKQRALGQGMSKGAKIAAKAHKVLTKVGPGSVKTIATVTDNRQPVKENTDRAVIDWYKENYDRDWRNHFEPHGSEDELIMKAYREWQKENNYPSISDVFY